MTKLINCVDPKIRYSIRRSEMKAASVSVNAHLAFRRQNLARLRNISSTFNTQLQRQRPQIRRQVVISGLSPSKSFSSYAALRNKQSNNNELPSFSFEGLGMSKGAKTFVILVLSIFGTIETWVWCKGLYRWWKGSDEGNSGEASHK